MAKSPSKKRNNNYVPIDVSLNQILPYQFKDKGTKEFKQYGKYRVQQTANRHKNSRTLRN